MVALIDLGGLAAPDAHTAVVDLRDAEALGQSADRALVLLDEAVYAAVASAPGALPPGWVAASTADSADAVVRAIELAAASDTTLLVVGRGARPTRAAIRALSEALTLDPMLGMAVPRITSATSKRMLAIGRWSGGDETVPAGVLAGQPTHRFDVETLSPCLLVRREVVGNLTPTPGPWHNSWGVLADYLVRARRAGFRTVIGNRILVTGVAGVTLHPSDRDRIGAAYPELDRGHVRAVTGASPGEGEHTLAAAFDRPHSLLLDARNLAALYNGTTTAILSVADALHQLRPDRDVGIWVHGNSADWHALEARYPNWTLHRVGECFPPYAAGLRLSQPWSDDDLDSLATAAATVVVWMLDTIAWDIAYAAPTGLDRVWTRVGREVDGLLFISDFSRQRFRRRFGIGPEVRAEVCRLSLAPADYQRPIDVEGPPPPYWLIVGNQYDHKHVAPTVDVLTRAFPEQPMVVFGDRPQARASVVVRYDSGMVTEQMVDACVMGAQVVVFPSFYEGFGLPIVQSLARGRVVVARESALVAEVAAHYRGTGQLHTFSTERELLALMGALRRGEPPPAVPLGTASWTGAGDWHAAATTMLAFVTRLRAGGPGRQALARLNLDDRWTRPSDHGRGEPAVVEPCVYPSPDRSSGNAAETTPDPHPAVMPMPNLADARVPRVSIVIVAWKQRDMLLACLQSLTETASADLTREVIVVSNDAPHSITDAVRSQAPGVRLIASQVNLGFGGACNLGVAAARGEYVVLLNDDAVVAPGWLEWLVATADAHPRAAAVGSLILFPDGRIQEAGSIIWADGSTMPVGRLESGHALDWMFVRRVDYVSACSLLVNRRAWNEVGGFDGDYHPAYYEDVDLCLALREHGYDVLFEPRSRVWHHESASSDGRFKHFLFRRNQQRIQSKWADRLRLQEPAQPTSAAALVRAVWRAEGAPTTILAVDDRVPDPAMGSGYGRMFDAVIELARGGHAVSLFPVQPGSGPPADPLVSAGVRIVQGDLRAHLSQTWVHYDVVLVSRPHNFDRVAATIRECQPRAVLVYDCEALFWRRMERQASLLTDPDEQRALRTAAADMRAFEERIVVRSDLAVTVSSDEADLLRAVDGCCPIRPIRPSEPSISLGTQTFEARVGVAYVAGWMAGTTSPNADGLRWFVGEVLPLVRQAIPWVRVQVTGANPPPDLLELADPTLWFTGQVADLASFYDQVRVVIAPIRFGAGVKVKTIQALQHGVPVVATTCGAEGIETHGLDAITIADDAAGFAAAVITLLSDRLVWQQQRREIEQLIDRWHRDTGAGAWSDVIRDVLEGRIGSGETAIDRG
jgi:O-antigen biosynthesis protein